MLSGVPRPYHQRPSPSWTGCTHKYIVLANILMTIGIFIEFMQKLQISFAAVVRVALAVVVLLKLFAGTPCLRCIMKGVVLW